MSKITDSRVVSTSVLVSISDVVLNILVAFFTGSTVMLAQAFQGSSDLITGAVLFYGVHASRRKADVMHPFGYGREVFFWVLIAGILMFIGTGGLSVYLGVQQIITPVMVEHVWVALIMLVFGLSTNFYSFHLSVKRLWQTGNGKWWHELRFSSVVETKATLLIDFLGTVAACIGLVALGIFAVTGDARFDGVGSIAIGLSMMIGAVLLMRDVRGLIVGRAVDPHVSEEIIKVTQSIPEVLAVLDLRTMYLGSAKLLVIMEVHLADNLDTDKIEEITDVIKATIHKEVPLVHRVQVEVETPETSE